MNRAFKVIKRKLLLLMLKLFFVQYTIGANERVAKTKRQNIMRGASPYIPKIFAFVQDNPHTAMAISVKI